MSNRQSKRPKLLGRDAIALLEIINRCLRCDTEEEYKSLYTSLQELIPFDYAISGVAKLDGNNAIVAYNLINISYPDEWMITYTEKKLNELDVIVQENFTKFRPQYWGDTYKLVQPSKEFISLAQDYGLCDGYTHGARPFGPWKRASLFSVSKASMKFDAYAVTVLETIVPHLHQAISNLVNRRESEKYQGKLSPRENEVLNWIKHGKSSWDISLIMGISERTVNYHIYNVMQKLDAVNRSQAVAVAAYHGLIDLD